MERAADIMRLLAVEPRRYRLAELARSLGLAKTTVHGILRTLQKAGLVEQDAVTGEYRLGGGLLHLGSRYLEGSELRAHAPRRADWLATRSEESVRIGVLHAGQVLIVHHVARPEAFRQVSEVGALLPAHSTALGKALLAGDAGAVGGLDGRPLRRLTRRTLTTTAELRAQLDEVRVRGWAADIEETTLGEASIAAPIRIGDGRPVGAIGVTGSIDRIIEAGGPRGDLVADVREAAAALERDLVATAVATAAAARAAGPAGLSSPAETELRGKGLSRWVIRD